MSKKMVSCRTCGADIAKSAKVCPSCGAKNKKPIYKRWWLWVLVVFLVIGMFGSSGDGEQVEASAPSQTETTPSVESTPETVPTEPVKPKHEHTVEAWTTATEPTCSAKGQKVGTCTGCGEEVKETIPELPHTEGTWKVTKDATPTAEGEKTLFCYVCGRVMKTEGYSITKEEYVEMCETFAYKDIARYPDDYDGKHAKFVGEVVQVLEETFLGTTTYTLRVNVTYDTYWYTDTVLVTYQPSAGEGRILEDDIIEMYGSLTGTVTYESIFGQSITIPSMDAYFIDLVQ